MRTQYYTATSLDGFIATGEEELEKVDVCLKPARHPRAVGDGHGVNDVSRVRPRSHTSR